MFDAVSCLRTDVDAVVDEIARKEVLITQNKLAQVRNLVISILALLCTHQQLTGRPTHRTYQVVSSCAD